MSYIKDLMPTLDHLDVTLSFVPVKENAIKAVPQNMVSYTGEEAWLKGNQKYIDCQFLKGRYVTRVVIKPKRG